MNAEPGRALANLPLPVMLIGFAEDVGLQIEQSLVRAGFEARRARRPAEVAPGGVVLVSGDDDGFLATVGEIRRADARAWIAVVTQTIAVTKWLDGLTAGANDFFSIPADAWYLRLMLSHIEDSSRRRAVNDGSE